MRVLYKDEDGQLTLQEADEIYWDKDENSFFICKDGFYDIACNDLSLSFKCEELLKEGLVNGYIDLSEYVFKINDDEYEATEEGDDVS